MLMPVVQSHDSANNIQSKEAAPLNVTALDGAAVDSLIMLGNTQLPDSARPSDPETPTADESNELPNGLPHIDEIAVGNASNSPNIEEDGPDNILDLTMAETRRLQICLKLIPRR